MSLPKVTVVGAGQVGATAAFCLLTRNVADVVLIDVAEGLPQGKALDMMHSRCVLKFEPRVSGTNDYADTAGSDVVVVTAGVPRRPGMTRDELLAVNSSIVRSVVGSAVPASPDAVFICVTNPLDVMTNLAWRLSGLPAERVFGMGGVLDTARFTHLIAEATGAPVDEIDAMVVGAHGDAMVPLPRLSMVRGEPLTEAVSPDGVDELVHRTVFGGAEVVALLKTGSAFYAPGASVASMVEAVLGDARVVMPTCALLRGEYGIDGLHMSVPAMIGRGGIEKVVELPLDEAETTALRASADAIRSQLAALPAAGA